MSFKYSFLLVFCFLGLSCALCGANDNGQENPYIRRLNTLSIEALVKKADDGDSESQFLLGLCYAWGEKGMHKDLQKSYTYILKAAKQGQADAECQIGAWNLRGEIVEKNYREAVKWFLSSAQHNNSGGQFYLALCYENGLGVDKNLHTAKHWYNKAALQGLAEAQYRFAVLSVVTEKKFTQESIKWLEKSAQQDNDEALYLLALCYKNGDGVKVDIPMAVKLLKKGVARNNPESQHELAMIYFHGMGGEKPNRPEAVRLLKAAASQGHPGALYDLGLCYYNGEEVKKDLGQAVSLFTKAANAGYADAAFNLFVCYINGEGVKQDNEEALKWLKEADKLGSKAAKELILKSQGNQYERF